MLTPPLEISHTEQLIDRSVDLLLMNFYYIIDPQVA